MNMRPMALAALLLASSLAEAAPAAPVTAPAAAVPLDSVVSELRQLLDGVRAEAARAELPAPQSLDLNLQTGLGLPAGQSPTFLVMALGSEVEPFRVQSTRMRLAAAKNSGTAPGAADAAKAPLGAAVLAAARMVRTARSGSPLRAERVTVELGFAVSPGADGPVFMPVSLEPGSALKRQEVQTMLVTFGRE